MENERQRLFVIFSFHNIGISLDRESKARCDCAIKETKDDDYIIIPGGLFKKNQLGVPVSRAMFDYLKKHGKPMEKIFPEVFSRTTIENVENIKAYFGPILGKSDEIYLITSTFHAARAKFIWKTIIGGEAKVLTCGSSFPGIRFAIMELLGFAVAILYGIHLKFPEKIFRSIARTTA